MGHSRVLIQFQFLNDWSNLQEMLVTRLGAAFDACSRFKISVWLIVGVTGLVKIRDSWGGIDQWQRSTSIIGQYFLPPVKNKTCVGTSVSLINMVTVTILYL